MPIKMPMTMMTITGTIPLISQTLREIDSAALSVAGRHHQCKTS